MAPTVMLSWRTNHMRAAAAATVVLGSIALVASAMAQQVTKAPTAADWAAMAKLPDFNGVWERGGGGGGAAPRGNQAAPAAAAAGAAGAAPQRGGGAGRGAAAGRGGGAGGARGGPSFTPQY